MVTPASAAKNTFVTEKAFVEQHRAGADASHNNGITFATLLQPQTSPATAATAAVAAPFTLTLQRHKLTTTTTTTAKGSPIVTFAPPTAAAAAAAVAAPLTPTLERHKPAAKASPKVTFTPPQRCVIGLFCRCAAAAAKCNSDEPNCAGNCSDVAADG
jgi:hypothetical protein